MKISNSFIYSRQEIIWERDRKFLKLERNDDNDDEEFFFVWYFVVVIFKKLGLFNYFLSLLLFIRNLCCFFFFSSKSRRSSRFDFSPGNSLFCILSLALFLYLSSYIQTSAKYQTFLFCDFVFNWFTNKNNNLFSIFRFKKEKRKGNKRFFSLNVTTTTTISYWGQNATMSQI